MYTLSSQSINFLAFQLSDFQQKYFQNCDIISYMGAIADFSIDHWRNSVSVNGITAKNRDVSTLVILLSTIGGSAQAVEKMVEITRHFYAEVYFVILDNAMSAGTIWAMSGDKIFMSYSSSLGPIDPQVPATDGKWVPALGYLDKINELIDKSRKGNITQAELMMLQSIDLGTIRSYEQAAELSKALLKEWLVKYKFKDWNSHSTNNNPVTSDEKEQRALEIANQLSDNKIWHSHGRYIGIDKLQSMLKLKIDDFSDNIEMCKQCDSICNSSREIMVMFSYHNALIVYGVPSPNNTQEVE